MLRNARVFGSTGPRYPDAAAAEKLQNRPEGLRESEELK